MLQHPWLADLVVLFHLAFVVFVMLGGVFVLRWPRVAWFHVPSVLWAMWVEFARWTCPLTPLENWLRGAGGYRGGFVDHYLLSLLYPDGRPASAPTVLGVLVLIVNAVAYAAMVVRTRRGPRLDTLSGPRPSARQGRSRRLPWRSRDPKGTAARRR